MKGLPNKGMSVDKNNTVFHGEFSAP